MISERLTDMFMMSYLTTDHAIKNGQSRGSGNIGQKIQGRRQTNTKVQHSTEN